MDAAAEEYEAIVKALRRRLLEVEEEAREAKFQREMENEEKLLEAETRRHDVRRRSLAFAAGPGGVAPPTTLHVKLPKFTSLRLLASMVHT